MRRTLLPFVVVAVCMCVLSCGRPPTVAENEILFTLTQTSTATDARWEFLALTDQGRIREQSDDCYYEALDERPGELRVEDGVATWKTPRLPDDGIVLSATESRVHLDRPVWRTGDRLTFVAHGFAMPRPKPVAFDAPPAELDVGAPVDGDIAVRDDRDLEVIWSPPSVTTVARVVVSLDSESGDRILCSFGANGGRGAVPASVMHVLSTRSRSRAGTLKIGTHRQVTVRGPDEWFIYVVAHHVARTQAFRLN